MIENSENENCNKTLQQKITGLSQNKLYNKYKIYSPEKCIKNIVKKMRAIPEHMNKNKNNK